jgi:hypothetical protein
MDQVNPILNDFFHEQLVDVVFEFVGYKPVDME